MITCKISSIKKGIYIKHHNEIYKIINFFHSKIAKNSAYIKLKLQNIINKNIIIKNFPSGHRINTVTIQSNKYQFLYKKFDEFYFMNINDFNQIILDKKFIKKFLKEGEIVTIYFFINKFNIQIPLYIDLPITVNLHVKHVENSVKGDTVNKVTKKAILETNDIIQVPLFIEKGQKIKINTIKEVYIEKIK